jgi:hypothetical protein
MGNEWDPVDDDAWVTKPVRISVDKAERAVVEAARAWNIAEEDDHIPEQLRTDKQLQAAVEALERAEKRE